MAELCWEVSDLLANNNSQIISKMARKSVAGNGRRNLVMITAVALAAFMLITVLTLGTSYFQANEKQNIRMYGAKHDAVVMAPTEKQIKMCREDKRISLAGLTVICSWADSNGVDDTLNTKFIWSDKNFWEKQKKPALEWIKGKYPQNEDELMISKAALKECGNEQMDIGSKMVLIYHDKYGQHSKQFKISGIFKDYEGSEQAYVSDAFYKTTGYETSDIVCGILYLEFKYPLLTEKQQNEFENQLHLGKQQRFFVTSEMEQPLLIIAGIIGIILITVCSAYLLIYNILYLSVTNNVRYYGLLQTVGMTEKQIKSMLFRKMFYLGGAGLTAGILIGSGTSFFIIPRIVKTLGIRSNDVIGVSFQPLVYLAAIVLICFTIYAGSKKPTKIASKISPIEATGYTTRKSGKSIRKTRKGRVILGMALQNMGKDKKKTSIVILSLALSASIFLCIITLIQSQGARTITSNYMDADLVLENDTLTKDDRLQYDQIFDAEFLEKLGQASGVKQIHKFYTEDIAVPWEAGFSNTWMREFYEKWMSCFYEDFVEQYKNHPEKFYSIMAGLDEEEFDQLNGELPHPIDKKNFMAGKCCIVYRNDLALKDKELVGQSLKFYSVKEGKEKPQELKIAGVTDDHYLFRVIGMAPNIIVSDRYMKKIINEPYLQRLSIQYQEEFDEKTEQELQSIIQKSPCEKDVSLDSKITNMENIRHSQGHMMKFGIGIVIILGMIGFMNYINTVISNIQNRLLELSILESIGMTDRQIRKMLIGEGVIFAGISLLLTSTLGMGVTYILYQSLNYFHVPFVVPFIPVISSYCMVILLCICIPLIAYQFLTRKKSVVERIKEFE